QQDGSRVVVDDERGLRAGEGAEVLSEQGIAVAAPAGHQVELQVRGVARRPDERRDRLLGERGAAEVRVQDDAARVDDPYEAVGRGGPEARSHPAQDLL